MGSRFNPAYCQEQTSWGLKLSVHRIQASTSPFSSRERLLNDEPAPHCVCVCMCEWERQPCSERKKQCPSPSWLWWTPYNGTLGWVINWMGHSWIARVGLGFFLNSLAKLVAQPFQGQSWEKHRKQCIKTAVYVGYVSHANLNGFQERLKHSTQCRNRRATSARATNGAFTPVSLQKEK